MIAPPTPTPPPTGPSMQVAPILAPKPRSRGPRWIRRVAHSRYAVPAMGLLSFLDACVSPILPEFIMVPLCLARPSRRWIYGTWCAIASVLGAVVGYYLGFWLWEAGLREIAYEYVPGFSAQVFDDISRKFGEHSFWWIVAAAFTPLPFKVFTVAAGVCHDDVTIEVLVMGSIVGRFPRFYLEVWLIDRFGPEVLDALAARKWLVLTISVALIGLWIWW